MYSKRQSLRLVMIPMLTIGFAVAIGTTKAEYWTEPSTPAACCYMTNPDDCATVSCDVNTQQECESRPPDGLAGDWLGNLDPPVADCTGNPCDTGATVGTGVFWPFVCVR